MSQTVSLGHQMRQHGRSLVDAVVRSLPLVILACLALFTHWLTNKMPELPPVNLAATPSQEPDYQMSEFTTEHYTKEGRLHMRLQGQRLLHWPSSDTFEVDWPHYQQFDDQGRKSTGLARRGLSNADGTEVQLLDQAQVLQPEQLNAQGRTTPAVRIAGDVLIVKSQDKTVESPQAVVLERGQNRFTADYLHYDHHTQILNLKGAVKGRIQPVNRP